jgi:DNA repair exonuclease SbcCD ATPase subunit
MDIKTEQLLQQFALEGLSAVKDLKAQNESLSKDMTDLKIAISTIREQFTNTSQAYTTEHRRLEKEYEFLRQKTEDSQKKISDLEKEIIALRSKDDSKQSERLLGEISEIEKRVGGIESQQNKWLGALTVLGVVIGFVLALLKGVLTPLLA